MKGLLVDGVDRHLGPAKQAGVIECSDFYYDNRQPLWTRDEMRAAGGAELARYRVLDIGAGKLPGRALGVFELRARHRGKKIGAAARNVLAFPAMALRLHHRIAFREVTHLATITTAFQFYGLLLVYLSGNP